MSTISTPAEIKISPPGAAPPRDTRLRGRTLTLARIAWVVITLFYVGTFLASLPVTLGEKSGNAQWSLNWPRADVQNALSELGLSYEVFIRYDTISNLVMNFIFFGLGIFIFLRRSDDWVALLFSVFLISFPGTVSFAHLATINPIWLKVRLVSDSLSSMTFIVLMIFPDGRFVPRWIRWVALGAVLVQVWRLLQPGLYDKVGLIFAIPVFFIALLYLLIFFPNPAYQAHNALGMQMFLLGAILWGFSLICLTGSIAMAIVRSHLWDIDVIIRKTLVYAVITAVLSLVYFGGVLLLQSVFTGLGAGQSPAALVLSTLAIAALFNPLRRWVQDAVDRRFYRKKYNAEKVLASFSTTLREEVDLDHLTDSILEVVEDTMQPAHVSLWLHEADLQPRERQLEENP